MSNEAPTDALRLVPVEPTEAMVADGVKAAQRAEQTCVSWPEMALFTYRAMLAAAPASPLPGGGWLGAEHLSEAITRLTKITAGDEIEVAYADFTFPGHTFRADVRALLSALPAAPTGEPK